MGCRRTLAATMQTSSRLTAANGRKGLRHARARYQVQPRLGHRNQSARQVDRDGCVLGISTGETRSVKLTGCPTAGDIVGGATDAVRLRVGLVWVLVGS